MEPTRPEYRKRYSRAYIESLARSHSESAIRVLAKLMENDDVPPMCRAFCAVKLLERGYGKALEMTETQVQTQLKVISEIVHVNLTPAELAAEPKFGEPMLIEGNGKDGNGSGSGNGHDTGN
jgi:hypothetical protein